MELQYSFTLRNLSRLPSTHNATNNQDIIQAYALGKALHLLTGRGYCPINSFSAHMHTLVHIVLAGSLVF